MDILGKVYDPDQVIKFRAAPSAEATAWRAVTATADELVDILCAVRVGGKDGECIIQGELQGGDRKKKLVVRQHILMLDHDTGIPIEDVVARYKSLGVFFVVWATHSHMKTTSTVGESTLERYRKKATATTIDTGLVRDYFLDEKFYDPAILEGDLKVERTGGANGVEYRLTHQPMPRSRGMVILDEPFEIMNHQTESGFTPQDERLKEWAQRYIGFGALLGLPVDPSCTDANRLMYLPSRPEGSNEDDYPIYMSDYSSNPRLLKLENVPKMTAKEARNVDNKFKVDLSDYTTGKGENKYVVTPGIVRFMHHAKTFMIADFVKDYLPDEIRPGGSADKFEMTCPNDGAHSNAGDEEDRGFFVQNADGVTGFAAHCQHATCKMESDGDRVFYLDGLCQMAGLENTDALMDYVMDAEDNRPTPEDAEEREEAVTGLTTGSTSAEIREVLRQLAKEPDEIVVTRELKDIAKATGLTVAVVRDLYNEYVMDAANEGVAALPKDLHKYDGPVFLEWDAAAAWEIAKAQIERANRQKTEFFIQAATGEVVRLVKDDYASTGLRVAHIGKDQSLWRNILLRHVRFVSVEAPGTGLHPPRDFVASAAGETNWKFNTLERIVNVPQLGPDMQLHFTEGYKADIRCYMQPNVRVPELPELDALDDVWADEVADAVTLILEEAVRDFPFSDYGDDDFQKPIKLEEKDDEGYNLPNLARGKGSRVNWAGMVLQGFIRPAINGPCPAYHIDKSAPGTGAGYLVRTAYYILTGGGESVISPSRDENEFNKMVTAALSTGSQFLFLDNINHKMDSTSLATALTAGRWEGRKLGKSEVLNLPIRCIWVMAGNSLTFTEELLRRNIPIMMDAKTANPARDRGEGDFKHHPMETWLVEKRPELVRAFLILVMNWLRSGHNPGAANLNSFTHWAQAVSGIFEAADAIMEREIGSSFALGTSFMSNLDGYLDNNVEETVTEGSLIEILHTRYGTERMSTQDITEIVRDPAMRNLDLGIEVRGIDEVGMARSVGKQVSRHFVNRTFAVNKNKYQLKRGRSQRSVFYQLVRVYD